MPICDPMAREQFRRAALSNKGRRASLDSTLHASSYRHPGYHHPYGSSLPPPSALNNNRAQAGRAAARDAKTPVTSARRTSVTPGQWLASKFNHTPTTAHVLQKQVTLPAVMENPPPSYHDYTAMNCGIPADTRQQQQDEQPRTDIELDKSLVERDRAESMTWDNYDTEPRGLDAHSDAQTHSSDPLDKTASSSDSHEAPRRR